MDEMNKIIVEATEKMDAFYFKTLQPFCEDVLETKINKDDLKYALFLWKKEKEKPKQEPKTVSIPKGATNGDVIKTMFPWVEVKEKNNGYEVYFGIGTASQYFNYQWWNAPYESEE